MKLELARRIRELPPYLFAAIDQKRDALRRQGVDLVDLGIGDPDLPTPPHIVSALQQAAAQPRYHRYPSYQGTEDFREAAARFCLRRFGLNIDAEREVLALIGTKEGIAHFPLAFVDPGDLVLVPDPGYPVYATWTSFAGGEVHFLPLEQRNDFLPDLAAIPEDIAARARVIWVNYPNNPTAAMAPREFYQRLVEFALRHNIIIASDMAYSEVYFGQPPLSLLEIEGARECAIEFHSLSKTYNMTGWRVGFAIGNAGLIAGLGKVKTNTDSGTFEAVQMAATAALNSPQTCVEEMRHIYRERMQTLVGGLRGAGFKVCEPAATFYCLVSNPAGLSSVAFASRLLTEARVVATPATGFGAAGEGYVRLTVCASLERIREAVKRIARVVW